MKHNRVRLLVDEHGRMTLVDVNGYEIVTSKLSVEMAGLGATVTVEIPGVKIQRGTPRRECDEKYLDPGGVRAVCGEHCAPLGKVWLCEAHR